MPADKDIQALNFISASSLRETLDFTLKLIQRHGVNQIYKRLEPHREVMFSKHDLYPKIGDALRPREEISDLDLVLWLLWYLGGNTNLLTIKQALHILFHRLITTVNDLLRKGVIRLVRQS